VWKFAVKALPTPFYFLLRAELGLDKPLYVEFGRYLVGLLHGELGYNLYTHQPIALELFTYLPATIELVLVANALAVVVGLILGVFSAAGKDGWLDNICRILSMKALAPRIRELRLTLFMLARNKLTLAAMIYTWIGAVGYTGSLYRSLSLPNLWYRCSWRQAPASKIRSR
jgi:ABC-type dipeptide/oligopeptide/nickel transport system permease component